ncbi:AraC family transcriptional regulator [Nitrogeniibacter mangrovi]|uniref:AraC family transcriptional regulator n=1 Tax=Nitrogeniibacter mangrovi TaxID=2016596 RepID=A0A6C1B4L5_9RHOO|nr:AraC family transcriptional regulator [Nitrogeniibacter mangrovi]QID18427.1 AraC family transcriptional regulator [Nitrogeniibacter mangrovi]
MNDDSLTPQEARIHRVCEYVSQNLDGELGLEVLSRVAALSRFHFHRVFSAYTGLSTTRFIQLARLRRASYRVAFEPGQRLIDIGFEAGFESQEAFSRAFKRVFGQSPSAFRSAPEWSRWHEVFQFKLPPRRTIPMQVEIVDFEDTPVALIEHLGPPEQVLDTAAQFIAWRKATGLSPVRSSRTFGVPFNDPNTVAPAQFRFHICGSMDGEVPENAWGVRAGRIPGGRCARLRHLGSHDAMDERIYWLYREWLPASGEALRDFPCFFHYLNFVHEVDECDLVTDIYLPLKAA